MDMWTALVTIVVAGIFGALAIAAMYLYPDLLLKIKVWPGGLLLKGHRRPSPNVEAKEAVREFPTVQRPIINPNLPVLPDPVPRTDRKPQ